VTISVAQLADPSFEREDLTADEGGGAGAKEDFLAAGVGAVEVSGAVGFDSRGGV